MTDLQTARTNAYRDLLGIFDTHSAIISSIPALNTRVTRFRELFLRLEQLVERTLETAEGHTEDKVKAKKAMAEEAAEQAAGALAYADDVGNAALKQLFDVSFSDVMYEKDEVALGLVRKLVKALAANQDQLEDYLVTAADVAQLSELADQFAQLGSVQGSAISDNRMAHKELRLLFQEIQVLLGTQLDRMMQRLKRRQPALVAAYFAIRRRGGLYLETGLPEEEQPEPPQVETN